MSKTDLLIKLCDSLRRLVAILELDEKCQWTSKFKSDLNHCEELLDTKPTKEDVSALAHSITYLFQGMGSFNDYFPAKYDPSTGKYSPISGTENFESVSEAVFNLANDLRRP